MAGTTKEGAMAAPHRGDASTRRARVFVVDDHPIVREGLTQLVNQEPDLQVCGEAGSARQALKAMAESKPDVAVVDLSLRETSGIQLIKDIKTRHPDLGVVVLSMYDERFHAERALAAGASGYIMKTEATDKVVVAIRRVFAGGIYLSNQMTTRVVRKSVTGRPATGVSPVARLTNRQFEIFELIGRGKSTREIAESLHRSVKTVETHRAHIMKKLELKNARELQRYATQWVQDEGIS